MRDVVLSTRDLSKRFKDRWAVRGLNLDVEEGDVFGFLGPNGAGKSTTIRMVLSLIRPSEGDVRIFGRSLRADRSKALADVGGIVEKPDFYLYLSALRNLQIVASLSGGTTRARMEEVLDMVGLRERGKDPVKTYSHGMKQRLGIAQALLTDPRLVVLDEPTNGLDPHGMKEIRDLIRRLSRDLKKTVVLSSHILHEVEMVANRMAVINRGTLVVQGDVATLLNGGETVVELRAEPLRTARAACRRFRDIVRTVAETDGVLRLSMETGDVATLVARLVRARVRVLSVQPRRSLEEYFLSITGQGGAL